MFSSAIVSNTRVIAPIFEKYQKERLLFAQTIAELAARDANIEALQSVNTLILLKPLLTDEIPAIQQAAVLALGRLANFNEEMAQAVVDSNTLPELVLSISKQNRFYKKASTFVLRAVAKHSSALSKSVIDCGGLAALILCLEDFDPGVKESAVWAIGYIARHNEDLAKSCIEAGALPLLILCLQEPELSLRRVAASALSDLAKHSAETAQYVVDSKALTFMASQLTTSDSKLCRQICSAFSQIAKHSINLAEHVVEIDIFPALLNCMKSSDAHVRKNGATLVGEIVKHSPELAQFVVSSGGVIAMTQYLCVSSGLDLLPGIMSLGYIAAFSATLATSIISGNAVAGLAKVLDAEVEIPIKGACAWSLGQIGRHSAIHAKALTDHGVLPKLLRFLNILSAPGEKAGADLKAKVQRAIKGIVGETLEPEALNPLLDSSTNEKILKCVTAQFAKILSDDVSARRSFVTSGALQRLQIIAASHSIENPLTGTKLGESIRLINECYPEEIVRYYSPGYSSTLLDKIEEYSRERELKIIDSEHGAPDVEPIETQITAPEIILV